MSQGSGRWLPVLAAATVALALVPSSMPTTSTSASSGAAGDPLAVALTYLEKGAAQLGVTSADVADLAVTSSYRSAHNGVTHVNLNQRHDGLEVFGGQVTVNVAADGSVLLAAGSPASLGGGASGAAKLEPTEAVTAAADALDLAEPAGLEVLERSGTDAVVSGGGISDAPIPARLGWQPTASGLRLAWQLVIDDSSDASLWKAIVDAETGALLEVADWTSHDDLGELSQRLARSTFASSALAAITPPTQAIDGSSYRVFDIPKESPNDGTRGLLTNPADGSASPFGWHDTNGVPGPEFTITRGNNVHAYLDQDNNNAADVGDTDGGAGLDFDFPADLTQHAQNYRDAVVTNLFYMNSAFHDVMWRYGFDEQSGNFQADNYGRGGTGTDYVRAEAADGGGVNNANFSTPAADGGVPRMQMYLWPGDQFGPQNQVVVTGLGSFGASWARFSPAPTVAGTSGSIVDAGNGCVATDYTAGSVAIVTGGNAGCQNVEKARQASTAGAAALIVAHNAAGAAPVLSGAMTAAPPTIPVASITQADGNAIRAALPATGTVRKHPNHPGIRDGDFENGIVIHEYAHGVSNRLTGGPGINCLSGDEQGGEGWSDYYALTVLLDPTLDDPEGPRGMGPYALHQDSREGAGIRPRPYSRNMAIQPFTYDSIKSGGWLAGASLAVPHGIGHGWASILWDLNWELIDKHGFNPNVYEPWTTGGNNRSLQYVTDGLKMQGCAPGFVAARNGVLAGAAAVGGEDTCTVWAAFARRGVGFSAVQGTTARDDNSEAFDTHPDCKRGFFGNVQPGPTLNVRKAGTTAPMIFTVGGNQGLDILAANNPYSRQVECHTLRTIDPNAQFTTPRPIPVPALSTGNSKLSYNASTDRYTFQWRTLDAWAGSCREFVLQRTDGVQHRAFFRFEAASTHTVSGTVRDVSGAPVPGATVRFEGGAFPQVTTTASNGTYSLDVPSGTYEATASAGGCSNPHTQTVSVTRTTRLDFSLGDKTDPFGYTCRLVDEPFAEGDTVVPITGDDVAGNVTLPFAFTLYGNSSNQARICTNGFVEIGQTAGTCPFSNGAIPSLARPNGAVYPLWDDFIVDAAASIRTGTSGAAPNRRFVIEWRNVHFFGDTSKRVDFNVVLHENGELRTQYRNIADDGRERGDSATIGIENMGGSIALQFSLNEAGLGVQPAVTTIRYVAPQTFPVSGQVVHADGTTPAAGATVTLERPQFSISTTTDASGAYSFAGVPAGSYDAQATAGLCRGARQSATVTGATTLNFTLGDQTDTFGYSCRMEDAAFEEATTILPIAGDDVRGVAGNVTLPFAFTLYGQSSTGARICTNGYVELGESAGACEFGNTAIPTAARPNSAIYPFWDDLIVDAAASIRADVFGSAPNRRFVIEWRNAHFFGDSTRRVDFNVVLHENGQILTQYRNIAADGREQGNSATIGIENGAGTVALQFSLNQAILGAEPAVTSIRFTPPT